MAQPVPQKRRELSATNAIADQWQVFKGGHMILTRECRSAAGVAEPWAPCLARASASPARSSGNMSSTETVSKP